MANQIKFENLHCHNCTIRVFWLDPDPVFKIRSESDPDSDLIFHALLSKAINKV